MRQLDFRAGCLEKLSAALTADGRLVGAVLVGSGATGFIDDDSDIDVVAVVDDAEDAAVVHDDWAERLATILPVADRVTSRSIPLLQVFLLDPLLEIDMGCVPLAELRPTATRWRILFDRTGAVHKSMEQPLPPPDFERTAYAVAGHACGLVRVAAKAFRREEYWTARRKLDSARTLLMQLAAAAEFGEIDASLADRLPAAWHSTLEATCPSSNEDIPSALGACATAIAEVANGLRDTRDIPDLGYKLVALERATGIAMP